MSATTEAAGAGHAGKAGGKKKLIVIGAAALGLVLVAGGAAVFLMGGSGSSEAPAGEHGAAGETVHEPYFQALAPITVNLNNGSDAATYLQLEISLELSSEATAAAIAPRMPRVMDAFQVYLRELRGSDLEGSAGVYRLKEELLRRVNIAVYPAVVDDILFQSMLVQ